MSDSLPRRHGLETFLRSRQAPQSETTGVLAVVLEAITQVNLRGNAQDAQFVKSAGKVLGQPLPIEPNTISRGEHRVYWLGPDEWLIVSEAASAQALASALQSELENRHAAVNDISGGQVTLRLTGANAADVLAKGCTLDFHPDLFKAGDCAQSGLGKANVVIGCIEPAASYEIVVRRSFAEYLALWLQRAASGCW